MTGPSRGGPGGKKWHRKQASIRGQRKKKERERDERLDEQLRERQLADNRRKVVLGNLRKLFGKKATIPAVAVLLPKIGLSKEHLTWTALHLGLVQGHGFKQYSPKQIAKMVHERKPKPEEVSKIDRAIYDAKMKLAQELQKQGIGN